MYRLGYKDKVIEYDVIKSNIKHVYIYIKENRVIVKAPKGMPESKINEIVNSKKKWIYEKIDNIRQENYQNGDGIEVLGKRYMLCIDFLKGVEPKIQLSNMQAFVVLPLSRKNKDNSQIIKGLVSELYEKIAEREVSMAMVLITRIVGVKPNKYRVKKLKTAWGTCTSNKNITINSELMRYDRQVIQYVVLHEICHLKYMNHSKEFWNMVEKYMKNYKEVRNKLKG